MSVNDIAKFLNTYSGRDKIIRTLCYSTRLISAFISSKSTASRLDTFSSEMSKCRTLLRLFDDIPMLSYTLAYGLGKQEKDKYLRLLGLVTNAVDQIYFPIEHIAWAADHNLISIDGSKWDTASTVLWVASLYLGLIKSVRYVFILQHHKACLKGVDCDISVALERIQAQRYGEMIAGIRAMLDLIHAINCLPPGFLWSGKLQKWHVGALGTASSLLGLYQAFPRKSS